MGPHLSKSDNVNPKSNRQPTTTAKVTPSMRSSIFPNLPKPSPVTSSKTSSQPSKGAEDQRLLALRKSLNNILKKRSLSTGQNGPPPSNKSTKVTTAAQIQVLEDKVRVLTDELKKTQDERDSSRNDVKVKVNELAEETLLRKKLESSSEDKEKKIADLNLQVLRLGEDSKKAVVEFEGREAALKAAFEVQMKSQKAYMGKVSLRQVKIIQDLQGDLMEKQELANELQKESQLQAIKIKVLETQLNAIQVSQKAAEEVKGNLGSEEAVGGVVQSDEDDIVEDGPQRAMVDAANFKENECPTCLADTKTVTKWMTMGVCGHVLCEGCSNQYWGKAGPKTCPVCKKVTRFKPKPIFIID